MSVWLPLLLSVAVDPKCAACHRAQSQAWAGNSMSKALYLPRDPAVMDGRAALEFTLGRFRYRLERRPAGDPEYTVTDGVATVSAPVRYVFGQGFAGQTYVYQYEGRWYESRLSYYRETQALDLTMGAPPGEPKTVVEAAGREMTQKDVVECFACHTTGSVKRLPGQSPHVDFPALQAGVSCENCHVGAGAHAASLVAGAARVAPLPKLARMAAEEQNDMCGRCHRTWADIATNGPRGIGNVRFQPYRITNAKCYDAADTRISCTACHDVHAKLDRVTANYDRKCAACHTPARSGVAGKAGAKVCAKATRDCASCHMPRYEIPGSHHRFTDHQIRVVRTQETYPN